MNAKIHRLRAIPAIAFENDEGRLRHQAGEPRLEAAQAAERGPHQPWSMEVYNLQMASQISIALLDRLFQDAHHLADLTGLPLRDELKIDELSFILHQVKDGLHALQPR